MHHHKNGAVRVVYTLLGGKENRDLKYPFERTTDRELTKTDRQTDRQTDRKTKGTDRRGAAHIVAAAIPCRGFREAPRERYEEER